MIKPCPFCGNDHPTSFVGAPLGHARCSACGIDHDDWNKRHSQWISVEDRLPEGGEDVLTYHKEWGMHISSNQVIIGEFLCDWKPTDWMPLPDPPMEDE